MEKHELIQKASDFTMKSRGNRIGEETGLPKDRVGTRIFEAPIFAFGSAEDDLFLRLKEPAVIGEHFRLPKEWLPQAQTVVCFFLPFSEAVKRSNRGNIPRPSDEWLVGRVEGQEFVNSLSRYLKDEMIQAGYKSVVPIQEKDFFSDTVSFTANWSERHAAYVCGLGTFGLSKGFITKKGTAGRLGSLITEGFLPPDIREYDDPYAYCTMCGACIKNCPVQAISSEDGKDHRPCWVYLRTTAERYKPRYGCGKCQVGVPCESRIPADRRGR